MKRPVRPCIQGLARLCLMGLLAVPLALSAQVPAPVELLPPIALPEGSELRIILPRGELALRPSTDGQLRVIGRLAPGQRLRAMARPEGPILRVLDEDRPTPAAAELTLQVPPTVRLSIDVEDASLDLVGVGGDRLRIQGGAQALRVQSSAARVRASSLAGGMDLQLEGGDLEVDSLSGAVQLAAAGPGVDLRVQSLSGNIALTAPQPGRVRVASISGAIEVTLGQGEQPALLDTVGGDIALRLAEGVAGRLSFAPGRQPLALRGGRSTAADGSVALGEGDWAIRLATVSGRLVVRQGAGIVAEPPPEEN